MGDGLVNDLRVADACTTCMQFSSSMPMYIILCKTVKHKAAERVNQSWFVRKNTISYTWVFLGWNVMVRVCQACNVRIKDKGPKAVPAEQRQLSPATQGLFIQLYSQGHATSPFGA